jgi:hypothetical protein
MPRGGYREKAGRKSTWKSGCMHKDTKLIRVPISIADELLKIAHKLDAGESFNSSTEQLSLPINLAASKTSKVNSDTRLSGVELARLLGVSSAALTPYIKKGSEALAKYTRSKSGIAWEREGKKYKPIM